MRGGVLVLLLSIAACSSYETASAPASVGSDAGDGGGGAVDAGRDADAEAAASVPDAGLSCTELLNDPFTSIGPGWSLTQSNGGTIAIKDGVLHSETSSTSNAFSIGTLNRTLLGTYAEVRAVFEVRMLQVSPLAVPGCVLQLNETGSQSSLQLAVSQLATNEYLGTSNFRIAGKVGTAEPLTIPPLAQNNWSRVELIVRIGDGQIRRSIRVDESLAEYAVTDDKHLTFTDVNINCGSTVGVVAAGMPAAGAKLDVRNLILTACNPP